MQFPQHAQERFWQQEQLQKEAYLVFLKFATKRLNTIPPISFDRILNDIHTLAKNLTETENESPSNRLYSKRMITLRREVYLHPELNWTAEYASEQLHISRSYFHKLYQKTFNVSFLNDVQQSRISNAKKLLLTTDKTLQEIADLCGYEYVNFMRTFKKKTGFTPTRFRKEKA